MSVSFGNITKTNTQMDLSGSGTALIQALVLEAFNEDVVLGITIRRARLPRSDGCFNVYSNFLSRTSAMLSITTIGTKYNNAFDSESPTYTGGSLTRFVFLTGYRSPACSLDHGLL
jgi:hypothetical protein